MTEEEKANGMRITPSGPKMSWDLRITWGIIIQVMVILIVTIGAFMRLSAIEVTQAERKTTEEVRYQELRIMSNELSAISASIKGIDRRLEILEEGPDGRSAKRNRVRE